MLEVPQNEKITDFNDQVLSKSDFSPVFLPAAVIIRLVRNIQFKLLKNMGHLKGL